MNQRTPQQNVKSHNVTQDDEQHNAALRRRNYEKTWYVWKMLI